jgi:phage gp46-like protein
MTATATMPLGDFALVWGRGEVDADMVIDADADDVLSELGLRTAMLLSIYTDRRAEDDDPLPAGADPRGWWADEFAAVPGDRFGSRLWLLVERGKGVPDLAARAEEYAREALDWLLEDKVAASIDVEPEVTRDRLALRITAHRPNKESVSVRYAHVWAAEEER